MSPSPAPPRQRNLEKSYRIWSARSRRRTMLFSNTDPPSHRSTAQPQQYQLSTVLVRPARRQARQAVITNLSVGPLQALRQENLRKIAASLSNVKPAFPPDRRPFAVRTILARCAPGGKFCRQAAASLLRIAHHHFHSRRYRRPSPVSTSYPMVPLQAATSSTVTSPPIRTA
jgi:hypothetical protein